MTIGGDGGNIIGLLSPEKYKLFIDKKTEQTTQPLSPPTEQPEQKGGKLLNKNDELYYKNKYLKYKQKYLNLKYSESFINSGKRDVTVT